MDRPSSRGKPEATPLRPWPCLLAACLLAHGAWTPAGSPEGAGDTDQELEILEAGWLDEPVVGWTALWRRPRRVVVARRPGHAPDVYQAFVRFSPEGEPIATSSLANLSRTPGAAEHSLRIHQLRAAWLVSSEGRITAAELAAFEPTRGILTNLRCWIGEAPGCNARIPGDDGRDWSRPQRWQMRLQSWQELGSPHAVGRARVGLTRPVERATLQLDSGGLRLWANGEQFSSDAGWSPRATSPTFRWQLHAPGRPGNVTTWLAERLRRSRLGENGVALLKAVGFAGWDYARRARSALGGPEPPVDVLQDLAGFLRGRGASPAPAAPLGWPPAPLEALLRPPAPDEGRWVSLDGDPFVARGPEGVAPFAFSFLRPDRQRPYVQAYIVLWDPRRLALDAVAGTEEPRSSEGERGTGRIPREPRVLHRLAGAFNGGFRTRHGEFGMATSDVVYLPPKPYAATVATLTDGSTGLGTWPDSPGLPPAVGSFRQNMTPLVQDGVANPYRRHWWGGTPEGWRHESFTVRTALCLTREGFLAYVYGDSLDPESLIRVAQALRCDYAMHLDMNAGHTGFELYRTAPAGSFEHLAHPLEPSWQARGKVRGAEEIEFVARRLTRRMPLMNFPRYIHREQRDFFYLTLRATVGMLPLPPSWRPSGPTNGWHLGPPGPKGAPTSWAHAALQPFADDPAVRAYALTLDPGRLAVRPLIDRSRLTHHSRRDVTSRSPIDVDASFTSPRSFGVLESEVDHSSGTGVWWQSGRFSLGSKAPDESWIRVAWLLPAGEQPAVALVGIDPDGFLFYVDVEPGRSTDPSRLLGLAQRLGLREALPLTRRLRWTDAAGRTVVARERASHRVELTALEGPGARRIFTETPIVPPRVWAYRQLRQLSLEPVAKAE